MTQTTESGAEALSVQHDNAALLREGFAAFERGDLDTIKGMCAADVAWTIPGTGPISGTYSGWDAVLGLFMQIVEKAGSGMSNEVLAVAADGDESFALVDTTATIDGRTETYRYVYHGHSENGLLTTMIELPYDYQGADAFWQ
jgi:ketosteroid isomerase-like protein